MRKQPTTPDVSYLLTIHEPDEDEGDGELDFASPTPKCIYMTITFPAFFQNRPGEVLRAALDQAGIEDPRGYTIKATDLRDFVIFYRGRATMSLVFDPDGDLYDEPVVGSPWEEVDLEN